MESASEPTHDWRVWYDPDTRLWCARRWDEVGGICTADRLFASARFETDGRFLRFQAAEAKIGTETWIQNQNVHTAVLRMVPLSQFVPMPVVASMSEARGPG